MRLRYFTNFLPIILALVLFPQPSTATTFNTNASYSTSNASDSDPQTGTTGTVLSSVAGSSENIFAYAVSAEGGYLAAETSYMSGTGYVGDPPVLPELQTEAFASWEETFTAVETKNHELQLRIPSFSLKFDDNSWTGMNQNTPLHMISAYDIKVKVDGIDVWTSAASFEGGQNDSVLNRSGTELSATYGTSGSIYFRYDFPANDLAIDLGAMTTGQNFTVRVELTAKSSGPPLENGSNCDIGGLGDPPSFSTDTAVQARLVAPYIAISPDPATMAATQPGETSESEVVTISNTGLEDLEITGISLSDETNYSVDLSGGHVPCNALPVTLTPGSICTVEVAFSPQLLGVIDGELSVTSNALNGSPKSIALSGNGWSPFNPWSKTYGGKASETAISFFQTSDGGYLVLGRLWDGTSYKPWILKLTGAGAIEWQKTIDKIGEAASLYATSLVPGAADTGCVMAGIVRDSGSEPGFWLVALNADGDVLLEKTYTLPADDVYGVALTKTADGGYAAALTIESQDSTHPDQAVFAKLDTTGDILWQNKRSGLVTLDSSLSATADSGILFSSRYSVTSQSYSRLGSDGSLKWRVRFNSDSLKYYSDAVQDTNGGILLASDTLAVGGGAYVAKFAENWDPVFSLAQQWGVQIDSGMTTTSRCRVKLEPTKDGGCLVLMPQERWIGKVGDDGTLAWQRSLADGMIVAAVRQTANGGYALLGTRSRPGAMDKDLFVLKLDAQGLLPGCDDVAAAALQITPYTMALDSLSWSSAETPALSKTTETALLLATEAAAADGCPAAAADDDADGVPTTQECGPDGSDADYDGNGDGIADSLQSGVASFHVSSGAYITLAVSGGLDLLNVGLESNPSPAEAPEGMGFAYDLYTFAIEPGAVGGSAAVTLYLPEGASPDTYYKYGKTPDNAAPHWYEFLFDGETGAEIDGNTVTLHFVDGQRGDDDAEANGTILEPGGPAIDHRVPAPDDTNGSSGGGGSGGGCFLNALAER